MNLVGITAHSYSKVDIGQPRNQHVDCLLRIIINLICDDGGGRTCTVVKKSRRKKVSERTGNILITTIIYLFLVYRGDGKFSHDKAFIFKSKRKSPLE